MLMHTPDRRPTLLGLLLLCPLLLGAEDLVPSSPGTAPSYWCTWSAQNYMFGIGASTLDPKELEGGLGSGHASQAMTEEHALGPAGWASSFFPQVRSDLYLMYDDGLFRDGSGSFQIDERKFPSLAGLDAPEKLRRLNERTTAAGWRGAAVWCRNPPTSGKAAEQLVEWSRDGGIRYWKIDGGDPDFAFIPLAQRIFPDLKLEHVQGAGPFNGNLNDGGAGRFGSYQATWHEGACLESSDVFRTYDVSPALSFPTTLDRVAEALRYGNTHHVRALINAEDEVYLAATLGCTMGIMRHALIGLRPAPDADVFFECPRQCKRRMDEVVRAIRWQRLAQPFARFSGESRPGDATRIDDRILADAWTYRNGDTWLTEAIGKTIRQGAPARVSRGLPLPEVMSDGEPPFVLASRFPNGAVSVAVQGRTSPDRNWTYSPSDVTIDIGSLRGPIGVFGQYRSLTVHRSAPLGPARILAQDLAGTQSEDITDQVAIKDATVTLSGALIRRVGLAAATQGDTSDPGLVLVIRGQ